MYNYGVQERLVGKRVKHEKKLTAENFDKIAEKRTTAATSHKRTVKQGQDDSICLYKK